MQRTITRILTAVSLLPALIAAMASAATIRVPSERLTIRAGIKASVDGDTVLVADGTYTGTGNRNLDYEGKAITVVSENGADVTVIDCESRGRGFRFICGEGPSSRLAGFTICNGYIDKEGGGIKCDGSSPTITNCTITGNRTFEKYGDGGGIYCYNSSSPTITNCNITRNTTYAKYSDGGGIYCCDESSPTITNCTIAGNKVSCDYSDGGGIYCYNESSPTITNCTIAGNEAYDIGGGIYCYNSSPIILNCILWYDSPEEVYVYSGAPVIRYSNVQGGWGGVENIDENPRFVAPRERNFHLKSDSPCIDAGDPYSRLDLDGSINDMGRYGGMGDMMEGVIGGCISGTLSQSGSPYVVSEYLVIETDSTLIVEPGVELLLHNYSGVIVNGELLAEGTADDSIIITKFQEWDTGRGVQFIEGEGTLSFCRIEQCRNWDGGGIYCLKSNPSIMNCMITGNRSYGVGGGINCVDSSPTITNCTITENKADVDGGGIYGDYSSEPTITDCMIEWNTANDYGGGICCEYSSSPAITNCAITGNMADFGGGIHCCEASFPIITNCMITGNQALSDGGGGGICCSSASPAIASCTIVGNTSYDYGGGIYCWDSSPDITNCTIEGNTANNYGGGVYCSDHSSPDITNCSIKENTANNYGGGVYCCYHSSPSLTNCTIEGNTTDYLGAGICCSYSSDPTINNCKIIGNTSECSGGGIYCWDSSPDITNCSITANTADYGGAIYCYISSPNITDCTISGQAADFGGGIYCSCSSAPTISDCTITGNTAGAGGAIRCYNSSPIVTNCIMWNDSPEEIYVYSGEPAVMYSSIQGGWIGTGNIDEEPLFATPDYDDYRLLWGCPCIDTGDPDLLDMDGTRSDMGAYFFDQSKELIVYLSPEGRTITRGGSGEVIYTVSNCHDQAVDFKGKSIVSLPGGEPWEGNPLEEPGFYTIPARSNKRTFGTYTVPDGWPLGVSKVIALIGFPDELYDRDGFEFTVIENGIGDE